MRLSQVGKFQAKLSELRSKLARLESGVQVSDDYLFQLQSLRKKAHGLWHHCSHLLGLSPVVDITTAETVQNAFLHLRQYCNEHAQASAHEARAAFRLRMRKSP